MVPRGLADQMEAGMGEDMITKESLEAEFSGWEIWHGLDNRWHARVKGATPPVMVADDHLDGLQEEIIRKKSQLDERAWSEGRLSSRDG